MARRDGGRDCHGGLGGTGTGIGQGDHPPVSLAAQRRIGRDRLGIPEALGESLARSALLAKEYGRLVLSFIKEDENYLEHPPLLAGALWALARLLQTRADLLKESEAPLLSYVRHPNALFRALALWGLGAVGTAASFSRLEPLETDNAPVRLYRNESFENTTVSELAREARTAIRSRIDLTTSPTANG